MYEVNSNVILSTYFYSCIQMEGLSATC